jgi:hypothetical protein
MSLLVTLVWISPRLYTGVNVVVLVSLKDVQLLELQENATRMSNWCIWLRYSMQDNTVRLCSFIDSNSSDFSVL